MKMQGNFVGPNFVLKDLERWEKRPMEGHDMVRRMGRLSVSEPRVHQPVHRQRQTSKENGLSSDDDDEEK